MARLYSMPRGSSETTFLVMGTAVGVGHTVDRDGKALAIRLEISDRAGGPLYTLEMEPHEAQDVVRVIRDLLS